MIQILMDNEKDKMLFYDKLARDQLICEIYEQGGKIITITSEESIDLGDDLASLLLEMWLVHSKKESLIEMIKEHYYFEDKQEINAVLELVFERVLAKGNTIEFEAKEQLLQIIMLGIEDENPFDYHACITSYDDLFYTLMIKEIGYAIDEWKQEEQYQHFIQSLRDYIANQSVKSNVLHIVQGNQFTFYREDGHKFTSEELKDFIQQKPLYIVGLDENELNLTPILALSPSHIYIYGRDPSEAKTTAVRNIFQEQVTYKRLQSFPFAHVE
ncbi:YtxC-like family protein [Paraliobacillus sp. PM-2]|uniref:sporulation protein YtxC n=1 Tax=Paraliobacillus sp. PM-2 TaxID=1462524 RepID=UPI00061C369F|nr:sporulation protein YtxC [Paraliobacillus sp. PM-2]CQR48096.1 YtxC-like family protein [Paraliobacillus sp. PM-2]